MKDEIKYRFSPIKNEGELIQAIQYIAKKTRELNLSITGNEYPISSLTVFSHYADEFENLKKILVSLGEQFAENNGPFVKLRKPIIIEGGQTIDKVRIRKPDQERPQVGCNDFTVPDYEEFKQIQLANHPDRLHLIERLEYDMIEFHDPEFDVLAYVLSPDKTK